ncbi:hypothetical protein [Spirosoma sp. KUDC1026]|uniref:hypothetical protein n=1 Tax=Spirosoma sp. KUDC1026 TaxID=2745947 RepID=UPI00159BF036|nr:hypothetical protein [Spirosoma sp. KUDC1026]QKZ15168.1 hypothetical protein HU175_22105 [Spirosoma sp. KUDC1026]
MGIQFGEGKTEQGPGVQIDLTGDEVATAIHAYLVAYGIHIQGPSTIRVNGQKCINGDIYIDPSGSVVADGDRWDGRGPSF